METTLKINGMHCDACKRLIEKRLGGIEGVSNVNVTPGTGETSIVANRSISTEEIRAALAGTEYTVV